MIDSSNEAFWCTDYNAKKTQTLCIVAFRKKSRKIAQNDNFSKNSWCFFLTFLEMGPCRELCFFSRCNQCIKTLNLSYQTCPYNDFHFLAYNWFLQYFRPLVAGVKRKNFILKKYTQFSFGIRHIKPPGPEKVRNSPPPPPLSTIFKY